MTAVGSGAGSRNRTRMPEFWFARSNILNCIPHSGANLHAVSHHSITPLSQECYGCDACDASMLRLVGSLCRSRSRLPLPEISPQHLLGTLRPPLCQSSVV